MKRDLLVITIGRNCDINFKIIKEMRIFNGTNSLLTLPLSGNQKLEIHPKSVSAEFMGGNEFLSMLVTSLSCNEIAIVVSGPYELNACANIPTAVNYVVQTLDEAIIRFGLKKPEQEVAQEPKIEEKPIEEEQPKGEELVVENTAATEEVMDEQKPTEDEKTEPVVEEKKPFVKKNKKARK